MDAIFPMSRLDEAFKIEGSDIYGHRRNDTIQPAGVSAKAWRK
jgi:hypothetical protein